MRLRQIAFIAHELEPIAEQLDAVFGLKVGFRDPGGRVLRAQQRRHAGRRRVPGGGLAPFRDDASGARYLARRGGDAGYMVILQDEDALRAPRAAGGSTACG